ncbi:MAG TPA: hypothetical protein VHA75_19445, partial [Rugosimonospora sp.]|nr:hypothetical protein [Rugosimonospora sp.]
VPAGLPRVAASAVRSASPPRARLARLGRGMAAAALRGGLSGLVLPDRLEVLRDLDAEPLDTVEIYLTDVLGRDLAVVVHIGPARPSRKPLLQLLTPEGATFAYAKLGVNALTARLVRLETTALTAVRHLAPRDVIAPPLLHTGQWRGHEVLVQGALPIGRSAAHHRPVPPDRLAAAQREIAFGMGTHRGSLAASRYWRQLRERYETTPLRGTGTADGPAADERAIDEPGVDRPDGGPRGTGALDADGRTHLRALAMAGDLLVAAHGDVE